MKDTIQNIIKSIEIKSDNGIDLINKVDLFYNSAWEKLIIIGSVSFAVIGVLMPLIIQWYQKKTLKISEELLKKEIENQSLKLKEEILESINKSLEEKINIFEKKVLSINASSTGKTFHLQGNGQLSEKNYTGAFNDYVTAAVDYCTCEEYVNLQRVLNLIKENCLPNLSLEEIEDLKISHNCDLEIVLKQITEIDEKGMLRQLIRDIRLAITKLPKNRPKGV